MKYEYTYLTGTFTNINYGSLESTMDFIRRKGLDVFRLIKLEIFKDSEESTVVVVMEKSN